MQNKPNFRKAKMKLNFYSTKDYENQPRLRIPGKQTQSNPISKWAAMLLRLRVFVYRLALQDDMMHDIVQESMLEMFKFLGRLKKADRFWPWLYRIALNKVHHHYRMERSRRAVSVSEIGHWGAQKDKQEGLENLVSQELKQIVSAAMAGLKPRHRAVLTMRRYDEMTYADIASSRYLQQPVVKPWANTEIAYRSDDYNLRDY